MIQNNTGHFRNNTFMLSKGFSASFISKFIFLRRAFGNSNFALLDIGAGNHSASKTLSVFPDCEYHGVDMQKDYNNDPNDFAKMKAFYEMDLTKLNFDEIPDNYFDAILMVHIIEHLHNGDQVILGLLSKLKKSGYLYVEYPGVKSKTLPSMTGTLNFHDDPTHVRLYSVKELSGIFKDRGFRIVSSGTRRNPWFLMAMPFRIILNAFKKEKLQANVFWDMFGFAEYLWVKK